VNCSLNYGGLLNRDSELQNDAVLVAPLPPEDRFEVTVSS